MAGTLGPDPFGASRFRLLFDGRDGEVEVLHVSGLKCASRIHEIEEGGVHSHVHLRPDRSRWDPLVLRYATGRSRVLQRWRDAFLRDPFDPGLCRSGAVLLLDDAGVEVRSYPFIDAWPVSWEGPTLDAGTSELAIETLELAHGGIGIGGPS